MRRIAVNSVIKCSLFLLWQHIKSKTETQVGVPDLVAKLSQKIMQKKAEVLSSFVNERLRRLNLPTPAYRRIRRDKEERYKILHGTYDSS